LHTKAFPYNNLIDRGLTPVFGEKWFYDELSE